MNSEGKKYAVTIHAKDREEVKDILHSAIHENYGTIASSVDAYVPILEVMLENLKTINGIFNPIDTEIATLIAQISGELARMGEYMTDTNTGFRMSDISTHLTDTLGRDWYGDYTLYICDVNDAVVEKKCWYGLIDKDETVYAQHKETGEKINLDAKVFSK